jgi:hypothetical protein
MQPTEQLMNVESDTPLFVDEDDKEIALPFCQEKQDSKKQCWTHEQDADKIIVVCFLPFTSAHVEYAKQIWIDSSSHLIETRSEIRQEADRFGLKC